MSGRGGGRVGVGVGLGPGLVRVFSVDPGVSNVGLCVFDWDTGTGTQTLVELTTDQLDDPGTLLWQHQLYRTEWIEILSRSIESWINHSVTRHFRFDRNMMFVVEENDIKFTRDWAPLLIEKLGHLDNAEFFSVLPKVVHNWLIKLHGLPKKSSRSSKKNHVMNMFRSKHPVHPFSITEHSSDAWVNAQYIIYVVEKKKKFQKKIE